MGRYQTRQRQGFPGAERMFKYPIKEGNVRMGCQASMEESAGLWEVSQDLLGASLILALLMSGMGPGQYGLRGGI